MERGFMFCLSMIRLKVSSHVWASFDAVVQGSLGCSMWLRPGIGTLPRKRRRKDERMYEILTQIDCEYRFNWKSL